MDEARIQAAIRAHRRLVRVYRHPERAPEWAEVMADLVDAEAFYRGLEPKTLEQCRVWAEIQRALKR